MKKIYSTTIITTDMERSVKLLNNYYKKQKKKRG